MASRGLNKVMIIGNLGNEPESRYMPSGSAVTNISIATSDSWRDKTSGEQQERTEWHRVTFFGKLAEIAAQYLHKGSQVYVEGRLQTRKWQDKTGQDRYSTDIIANEMQMLGRRGEGSGGYESSTAPAPAQQQAPAATPAPAPAPASAGPVDDFDDDVPF